MGFSTDLPGSKTSHNSLFKGLSLHPCWNVFVSFAQVREDVDQFHLKI